MADARKTGAIKNDGEKGEDTPLGKFVDYPETYEPALLFAIPRAIGRGDLGISADASLPFQGEDFWTAFEISWCNDHGMPQVAVGEFVLPSESPNIIESKSLKLYLNSLNQHRLPSWALAQQTMVDDLSLVAGAPVGVQLYRVDEYAAKGLTVGEGLCLDDRDVACTVYQPDSSLLALQRAESDKLSRDQNVAETLYSHLMKSNCPVTGQPDWATISLSYRGQAICHDSLLRYIVSFREHQGFHEHCVEKVFMDILQYCKPDELTVSARYTRRGGLDINPMRMSSGASMPKWVRTGRQ